MDAAYGRHHMHPDHAVRAVTIINNIAYMLTILPFGAVAGPSLFSRFSEAVSDLSNDIIDDTTWDHENLVSPISQKLNKPISQPTTIPFGSARPLIVYIPNRLAFIDGYIDDAISVGDDLNNAHIRSQQSVPLAIHSIFRPTDPNELSARNDSLADKKLKAEGTPKENQTVLGWDIDTRKFTIGLPPDKVQMWSQNINDLLKENKVTKK